MNKRDIKKLLDFGFFLLRIDDEHGPAINFKSKENPKWTRYGQIHPTKSARNKILADLLESSYHLEL